MAISVRLFENKPLEEYVLPKLLKIVRVKEKFNHTLINLPDTVEVIVFDCSFILPYRTIPMGIKKIFISLRHVSKEHISNLPVSVEEIIIKDIDGEMFLGANDKKIMFGDIEEWKIPLNCVVLDMYGHIFYTRN